MKRAVIVTLFICSSAIAGDFASRVTEAKQVISTPVGAQYDSALIPLIGIAIRACVPPNSTDTTNLGSFTLVSYVTATGTLSDVAIEPKTKVSSCFAERFSQQTFPTPPNATSSKGYPIVVEMKITP